MLILTFVSVLSDFRLIICISYVFLLLCVSVNFCLVATLYAFSLLGARYFGIPIHSLVPWSEMQVDWKHLLGYSFMICWLSLEHMLYLELIYHVTQQDLSKYSPHCPIIMSFFVLNVGTVTISMPLCVLSTVL